MEEGRKRKEYDDPGDVPAKRQKPQAVFDESEDVFSGYSIEGESLEALMQAFDDEASFSDTTNNPCFSSMLFPSSSFVTINGNEETCGPSFADASSTVMANVDTCGVGVVVDGGGDGSCVVEPPTEEKKKESGGEAMVESPVKEKVPVQEIKSCGEVDDDEFDDEWIAWIVNANPFEFEIPA